MGMTRYQFSTADILIGMAVTAIWMGTLAMIPPSDATDVPLRIMTLGVLVMLTLALHRLMRRSPKAWLMAALWAGLTVSFGIILVAVINDPP
jgi:hypothetical protein